MIRTYIEQTIKNIEADREKKVADVKNSIIREKIAPYNAEIDNSRAKALTELDTELNTKIVELRQAYEAKKQELVRLGEEKKKANADSVLMSELAVVTVKYDNIIAKLTADLAEIKE